ncbi:MAG: hypothetical protein CMN34_06015 [Saprospirales bacterium]|nr:hypothetical protein [Saprospirales bacterium]|tara:strand:+ start:698 stop:3361 length:2664 start_codon:yes stop_codon:yes gene_type:complete
MPVFFGRGNIITKAKTVRTSSFIFTEASEVDITYENHFKEYVLDMVDGFSERQNIFYDPFKYSDYLERVTSTVFVDTKEVYSGEMYNTFFDSPQHNLEYVLGSSFNTEDNTNLVNTKYVSEIYQSLDNLLSIGMSYEQITSKIQAQLLTYSSMTLDSFDRKREYALRNLNTVFQQIKELGIQDINSKQIVEALYFGTTREVVTSALNPLDGTLNLNKVSLLLKQLSSENVFSSIMSDRSNTTSGIFYLDIEERGIYRELERSTFDQKVPILQNPETGLYYLEFKDTIDQIDDSMFFDNDVDRVYEHNNIVYGSPNVEYHPINNFFQRYMTTINPSEMYTQEKNDITIDLSPKYISDSDKTFVRSIFYIELEDYQDYLGYVPYVKTSTDTAYIPDEQFIQTKVHTPDKNIFKFRYEEIKFGGKYVVTEAGEVFVFYNTIEARYAGYYKDYDTLYEYINDLFLSTNLTSHDSIKPHETLYFRPESNHSLNGGSHLGHTVPNVMIMSNSTRLMETEYVKETTAENVDQEYKFSQIVSGRDAAFGKLFEFDPVFHDLDQNAIGDTFNFVYEVVNGRLPNCLTINNGIISGNIGETEQFLNQYSYESWVKNQNLEIDTNYDDFNPEQVKEIEVTIIGRSTTRGTIDIIDEVGFSIGDIITQRDSSGNLQASATVTRILFNYTREFSVLGADPQDLNIIRYEIDNIEGSFIAPDINQIIVNDELRIVLESIQRVNGLMVLESELFTASGLIKQIDLIFPINNNYTYDKDRFLLNTEGISDREDQYEWLTHMRSQGHYRFDVDANIAALQESIDELTKDYKAGRTNLTLEQFNEEIEFLELSKGNPFEEETYERLEIIEEFKLDCKEEVDEQTYYKDNPERVTTRGYPIYVSCN